MRLHTLRMVAVGPFADEQVVDFDRLSAGGLFLFEGPTGVGKSTILDAIAFALYGGLASDGGDPARMRSHFAAPEIRPEVALEFSVRGVRHRISRSPEYDRPKRRGSGVTRERASVHLERQEGQRWVSRSHAKDEVGTIIGDLLGLSREQFRQVVVLPQGEFASFLRADDDERRALLVRLFGTHLFSQLTTQVQAIAQEAARSLAAADSEVSSRLAAALEAAALEAEAGAAVQELPPRQLAAALQEVQDDLTRRARTAGAAADAAGEAERGAADARQVAHQRLEATLRAHGLVARHHRLERERVQQDARRGQLEAARRAAPVRALLSLVDGRRRAVDEARAELAVGSGPPELDQGAAEVLRSQAEACRDEAAALGHLVDQESRIGDLVRAEQSATLEVAEVQARAAALDLREQALPVALERVRQRLADARAAASRGPAHDARHRDLTARLEAAEEGDRLAVRLPALQSGRRRARRALQEAQDAHVLLVEHRIADLRGELAAQLVNGAPCLVCGSAVHPAPAGAAGGGVSDADVRAAADAVSAAAVAVQEIEVEAARVQAQLDVARARCEGTDSTAVRADLGALEQSRDADHTLAGQAGDLERELSALEREAATAAEERVDLAGARARSESVLAQAHDERARVEQAVREARGAAPSVAARVQGLLAQAAQLARQAEGLDRLARARADLAEAHEGAEREAREAGFADLARAAEAVLEPTALAELAAAVDAWDAEVAAIAELLRDPAVAAGTEVSPDDARALEESADSALRAAAEVTRARRREHDLAVERERRFGERRAEVADSIALRAARAAHCEDLVSLDQYLRGMAGTPRMSLVTFVLRYWFEHVVAAANIRLATMSSGKYALVRTDLAGRRDARVGLGLAVLDRHTGCERSPATLSGGESFYTSLSLALGLADVVTAQAGGVQLDTLFIDEGFGSLDPDTLDDVMSVIDDLRGRGRVVGIVSHVPELKERVAERLSVRRTRPDGPSTVHVLA